MGKKRMFGICSAMCSSSASVGENLCGVLELARGVGTIEKLWWICVAVERPHGYPPYWPFLMMCWGADALKGWREDDTCCRTFFIVKTTSVKLHFQAILFYCLLQCGDSEATGGSYSGLFPLLFTTHWEGRLKWLRHFCIFNRLQWLSV